MDVHPIKNGINRYWSIPICPVKRLASCSWASGILNTRRAGVSTVPLPSFFSSAGLRLHKTLSALRHPTVGQWLIMADPCWSKILCATSRAQTTVSCKVSTDKSPRNHPGWSAGLQNARGVSKLSENTGLELDQASWNLYRTAHWF